MRDQRAFLPKILLIGVVVASLSASGLTAEASRFSAGLPRVVLAKKEAPGRSGSGFGEDQGEWRERYREWESLPPEEKQRIRKRYERYKSLPPRERQLYEKRYRQWERLTPEQKKRVEESLGNWDRLTPEEQESVRRLFLR